MASTSAAGAQAALRFVGELSRIATLEAQSSFEITGTQTLISYLLAAQNSIVAQLNDLSAENWLEYTFLLLGSRSLKRPNWT